MFRILPLILFLGLASCIGHYSDNSSLANLGAPDEWPYRHDFIGRTQDDIVRAFGAPSRKATLNDGTKLFEYRAKLSRIYKGGERERQNCTIKLWLRDQKVFNADAVGDWKACDYLVETGEREHFNDLRHPF
jgi:hypothetical protein